MLTNAQITEIRKRANFVTARTPGYAQRDIDTLLADRDELVRRLAAAEAELAGLREIATSGPSTASGPSPLSHRAAPMEDARDLRTS